MIITRCLLRTATFLVSVLTLLAAQAQNSGQVSSGLPNSAAGRAATNSSSSADGSSKELPWKFLAAPMGVLDDPGLTADTIKGFARADLWDCKKNPGTCTPQQVEKLVQKTVVDVSDCEKNPATCTAKEVKKLVNNKMSALKASYVAIHVVDYPSGSVNNLSDSWYLYHWKDSKWSFQKFTNQRIYGSPTVLFLFVHLNVRGVSANTERGLQPDVKKALESNSVIPNPDPKKPPTAVCADDTDKHFQWLGTGAVVDDYANVHYESAVVKRTPANVANLLDILKILGYASRGAHPGCQSVPTELVSIWGAGMIKDIGLPSDVSIAGYSLPSDQTPTPDERSSKQIGATGSFNDEQLYWWDASIGIPVHKLKDLQYSDSSGTVVASQVDKQSAYAMFNLMLHPVDLSAPRSSAWPRILVGFPLSSSPWDRLFAGGALGIPIKPLQNFQFFAGATFNRDKQPATLAAGSSATNAQLQNDLRIKTTPKFTFGINVPVKSVLDKLVK